MKNRSQVLAAAAEREFDLVIIGGGIVGAGVAQDAASRGLSVLLLEKDDFASGTSSRTTKLIHGGLRYLEQLQFRLTRELCQERGLLETLAPHMVRDFSFMLPITKGKKFFGLKADVGLTLYDLLSINARGVRTHQRLNRKETLGAAPSLNASLVSGGLRFHDCITDDSRVVMEVIKSACEFGAAAVNYLEAIDFKTKDGRVEAIVCRDRFNGQELVVRCRACINATGVWSDILLRQLEPTWSNKVQPAKGTHIMLPLSCFETSTALFLPTNDGRYVFVVPWQKALMVGTTDIGYEGPLDKPVATSEEVDYLLGILNSYRKSGNKNNADAQLTRTDVIATWAGLRPLVGGEHDGGSGNNSEKNGSKDSKDSEKTATISREHLLFEGPYGVIGLIGGKLTNYRMLAIHVVDMALKQLVNQDSKYHGFSHSKTDKIMLGGWSDKTDFLNSTAQISAQSRKLSLDPATIDHLIATYGKDALKVIERVEQTPALSERICPDFPPIMAEVPYCLDNEMAISLEDILSRRIRLGFVHQGQCLESAPKVARLLQNLSYWDSQRAAVELEQFEQSLLAQLAPASQLVSV
ncbi:glycerol-3-phosphate dehydrogenase/oxidase [bacterium]|nr:glycerol-3-phosphate dehydrogenase/oxidase [bacterium]MBP9807619.1 glycerol-3-phosphate dehydrogenase/oxidase [bacterium]